MISQNYISIVTLNKLHHIVCLIFMIIIVLNIFKLSQCHNNSNDKTSVTLRSFANNNRLRYLQQQQQQLNSNQNSSKQSRKQHYRQQQRVMSSDEYEKLTETELKAINENNFEEQTKSAVVPSRETNGNSQVVFVDLTRVVSDGNKNETTRQVANNEQLIKQDGQIACGETNRNGVPSMDNVNPDPIQNRIVGGTKAEPGEFPFQVRLNIRSRRGSSLCGGVIIDQRHILTAAHCMTTCSSYFVSTSSIDPRSVKATIGDLRITVPDGEQVITIEKVTPHQQYSACSYTHNNYDIALLKTSKPMPWIFTKDGYGSVNRICLPHPYDEYNEGENVTVTGWGVMSEGEGTISNVLNAVDLPIVSNRDCKVAYGQRVNQDHVCAGLKQGGKDSCQGDSGGPLFRKKGGQSELVGIVSFGYGCAQANTPGVYTKVSHYIDWIEKNL